MRKNDTQKKFKVVFWVIGIIASCVIAYGGITWWKKQTHAPCPNCNILVISLDTCGARHMTAYGYGKNTTPNFTALAQQGTLFAHAYSNGTWTLPSHVSLFTGLYADIHKINVMYQDKLNPSLPFLPEILQKNGYKTYFFIPPDDATLPIDAVYNRGITQIVTDNYDGPGYFEQAMQTLTDGKKNTFVFFHTYVCHGPYFTDDTELLFTDKAVNKIPLSWREVYQTEFTRGFYAYLLKVMPGDIEKDFFRNNPDKMHEFVSRLENASGFEQAKMIFDDARRADYWGEAGRMMGYQDDYYYWGQIDMYNPDDINFISALYDQRLYRLDENIIGKLRGYLENDQIKNNTIVIITSDHGEEFMEHQNLGHTTLYDFNTQIPLLFLVPHMLPSIVQPNVELTDVPPTVLDIVGIQNTYKFNGRSLLPFLEQKHQKDKLMVASANAVFQEGVRSLREGNMKLFVKLDGTTIMPFFMYNTANDPDEKQDILGSNMQTALRMIAEYKQLLKKWKIDK